MSNLNVMGRAQWMAVKVVKGLKHLSFEKRLRELRLLSLEQRRLGGSHKHVKIPKGRLHK